MASDTALQRYVRAAERYEARFGEGPPTMMLPDDDDAAAAILEACVASGNPSDIKEMVAEGWAEYLNNPAPRAWARQIGEIVEQLYQNRHPAH